MMTDFNRETLITGKSNLIDRLGVAWCIVGLRGSQINFDSLVDKKTYDDTIKISVQDIKDSVENLKKLEKEEVPMGVPVRMWESTLFAAQSAFDCIQYFPKSSLDDLKYLVKLYKEVADQFHTALFKDGIEK